MLNVMLRIFREFRFSMDIIAKPKIKFTFIMIIIIGVLSIVAENENMNCVEFLATVVSIIIMVLTFPISIFICFKVVSEYERAVIFRMGRLRSGGARG